MDKWTDEQIIRAYQDGASLRGVAAQMGKSISRPHRVLRAAGVMREWGAGGPNHSQWTGGRLDAGQGYFRQWIAEDDPLASMRNHQGYVLEHRLVMARKFGRPLRSTETVNHINGDKGDNRLENLEVRQGQHGKHIAMRCLDCGSQNIGHVGFAKTRAI